jgi:hypothetical protein
MRKFFQTLAISTFILASASTAGAQVSFDLRIGPPPPPRVYRVPAQPGPDFVWVEGYWYPQGSHYRWHDGYWTRPPFAGAYWVAPYHLDGRYYAGRWEDGRRSFRHDHRWDRGRQRDEGRDRRRDDRR